MTIYIKEVLIRLASVPVGGSQVTLEVPEGTEIGASISITFSDGLGAQIAPVTNYSRVGQYITVTSPLDIGDIGVVMRIEQTSDFQDDATGNVISVVATNSVDSAVPASVVADNSEVGKSKLTFNIPKGKAGKSAYEMAVVAGFVGSEADYLLSLKGVKGDVGPSGADGIKGDKGDTGAAGASGKSNYELAVEGGFSGTQAEYLASLKGVKGDKGFTGETGMSAYELAVSNGFEGSAIDYLVSLNGAKGDKGDRGTAGVDGKDGVSIGGSRYDELAGGTFWWVRPRYINKPNEIYITAENKYVDGAEYTTKFVIEDTLHTDNGVYIPPTERLTLASQGQAIRVVATNTPAFSVASVGRIQNPAWKTTSMSNGEFRGAYYVEIDPATVVAQGINSSNLGDIEVMVSPTQASGYNVQYSATTNIRITTSRAKGVLLPIYLGAMRDPDDGKVYLLFRPVTYAKRRNTATVEDGASWDGIGESGGEDGGWLLYDEDVRWWSTNVAQGFHFVAKLRKR